MLSNNTWSVNYKHNKAGIYRAQGVKKKELTKSTLNKR